MKNPVTDEPSVGTLVTRAVDDAKRWGRAEVAYYRAIAGERGVDAGIGIGIGIVALLLIQAALTAMLVGIIMALSDSLGAGLATLVVVAVTLVIVAVLGIVALGRLRRVSRPLRGSAE